VTAPHHFTSRAGTWDDWLVSRPSPAPPEGTNAGALVDADYVAEYLHRGVPELLDFAIPSVRDGFRALLDEFERDTAGQVLRFHMPIVRANQTSINAVVIGERIRVIMGSMKDGEPVGDPLFVDMDADGATELCQRLIDACRALTADDPEGS